VVSGIADRISGRSRESICSGSITNDQTRLLTNRDAVREIGLEVHLGLHGGECEVLDAKVTGIAVAIGARVSAQAAAGRY
jgi:hypothetical protein